MCSDPEHLAANAGSRVNHFDSPTAAARYAADRPRGHARVLELMRMTLADHLPVHRALDVGCGTGHSTIALLPFASEITGVDSSSEMLAQAARHERIRYCKGYAESLPFRSANFDLVTVSSAYHWFDQERFLAEAARVLRPGGWLVLYKAGSLGRPADVPEFDRWRREVLSERYPKVARNNEPLTAARAFDFGFADVLCETSTHRRTHRLDDYVANLMTHSRVIRVVDGGTETAASARQWLRAQLEVFFHDGAAEFTHEDQLHVLRRREGEAATSDPHPCATTLASV